MEPEKIQQRIEEIEKEIKSTPYHKGTEHHIGKLKADLAKLRLEVFEKRTKKGGKSEGFAVKKEGDATVVLVGFPSVGKSMLLNKLTAAKSKVAAYPFTTLEVIPGMLWFQGAQIQVLDVPGLIQGASMGKGRGKEVISVVRAANLLLLIASVEELDTFEKIENELYLAGVRLNEKEPDILIEKRLRGGLEVSGARKLGIQSIKAIAQEFGILNGRIAIRQEVNQDQLIDFFMGNRIYVPAIRIVSKIDLLKRDALKNLLKRFQKEYFLISAQQNLGTEELKMKIFEKLNFTRIYPCHELGMEPNKNEPLICKKGVTVLEAAEKISKDLAGEIKGAKITGPSATYPNQLVGPRHKLLDEDQVFFVK